ncbi:MAG: TIGR01458 family HAD-type hydrolase [Gemmatimonadota bacterium]|nr:MAG: TIGR01458 family HAD-type hydrolase [Gemmatimonadota bacterium]
MERRPSGLLLDLDGTVYEDDGLIAGADAAIEALRAGGIPVRFVTNTTRVPRVTIAGWLEDFGVPAVADEIFTPPLAAVAWLKGQEIRRVAVCLPEGSFAEFAEFDIVDHDPQAVVVGDLGPAWNFDTMNRVFRWLLDGVEFVALHRNRYWKTEGEWVLDVGAFVAALEYATGREATLVGKPSRPMFEAAARSMGLALSDVAMVGDDLQADIAGAQAVGVQGFMVRTGKFRAEELKSSAVQPDQVVDSIAALPDLLLG